MFQTYEVMSIPDTMLTYTTITKAVAFALIPVLFIAGIVIEQAKVIKGEKPEYLKLIFNTLAITIALTGLYTWLFMKIIAICEAAAMSIFDYGDWYEFKSLLSSVKQDKGVSLFSIKIMELISSSFIIFATVAESVFEITRYSMLCVMYVVGPLAFVAGIFPATRSMLKGWFVNVFQISFWIVTLRILEATMLSLKLENQISGGEPLSLIMVTALFMALIAMTPLITAKLLSGNNLGVIGSTAMTIAGATAIKYGGKAINLGKGAANTFKNLKSSQKQINTIKNGSTGLRQQNNQNKEPEKQEAPKR